MSYFKNGSRERHVKNLTASKHFLKTRPEEAEIRAAMEKHGGVIIWQGLEKDTYIIDLMDEKNKEKKYFFNITDDGYQLAGGEGRVVPHDSLDSFIATLKGINRQELSKRSMIPTRTEVANFLSETMEQCGVGNVIIYYGQGDEMLLKFKYESEEEGIKAKKYLETALQENGVQLKQQQTLPNQLIFDISKSSDKIKHLMVNKELLPASFNKAKEDAKKAKFKQ